MSSRVGGKYWTGRVGRLKSGPNRLLWLTVTMTQWSAQFVLKRENDRSIDRPIECSKSLQVRTRANFTQLINFNFKLLLACEQLAQAQIDSLGPKIIVCSSSRTFEYMGHVKCSMLPHTRAHLTRLDINTADVEYNSVSLAGWLQSDILPVS